MDDRTRKWIEATIAFIICGFLIVGGLMVLIWLAIQLGLMVR